MPNTILFLDNPPRSDISPLVQAMKEASGQQCRVTDLLSLQEVRACLDGTSKPDLLFVDDLFQTEAERGLPFLIDVLELMGDIPVVVLLNRENAARADEIIETGATDVLIRDENLGEKIKSQIRKIKRIIALIEKNKTLAMQNRQLIDQEMARHRMVGSSPEMCEVLNRIKRIAKVPRPVLITGERGTGKELVARAIHQYSVGYAKPIVVVNCAAFSDELLESELFGHEKGAFTSADRQYIGKFEQAHQGTLFLDEIGNMSLSFQKKIMRVVEYGSFRRVGGAREIRVSTRIITATNANLVERIEKGSFLPDLYDRLAFEEIHLPALRERKGDVEVLANHFLQRFMEEVPDFQGKRLSTAAIRQLKKYHFPGNVRELKNIIERAVYRDTTNEISPEDIGFLGHGSQRSNTGNFKQRIEEFEKQLVHQAMEDADGNQAAAARILDISYHQLRYYLKKYGT